MLIRISNIDRSTSVDDIWDLFAEFGDVEEAELNEMPDPGKFTFTGYVVMTYAEEAEEALADLNGERIDGKAIVVKIVEAKDEISETLEEDEVELEDEEDPIPAPKAELRRKGVESED